VTGPVAAGAQEFEAKLASFVKENRLYGAAASVVHGDEIVWSGGVGFADLAARRPAEASTLYRIASITKTFTGTAIMQLRDAGQLELDDSVVTWLPELAGSGSPKTIGAVTIRRLLSHESGLKSEPPGTNWRGTVPEYEGSAERSLERAAEIFAGVGPNLQAKYSNLGYQLLGEIVHRASGTAYPRYLREQVLDPLGLSATAFEPLSDELAGRAAVGYAGRSFSDELAVAPPMPPVWAEGGLWSTVTDLGKWISFQLSAYDHAAPAAPVLSAATLREMHTARYVIDPEWTQVQGISWYAARSDGVAWVQHSGGLRGFTSNACFDPEQRVGAVALVNSSAAASLLAMELGAIARRLSKASPPVITPPEPTPEAYRSLLGLYTGAEMNDFVRVEWRDDKLMLVDWALPAWKIELLPGADADVFMAGPGFRQSGEPVRFTRLPDGRVASLTMGGGTLVRLDPVRENTEADLDAPAAVMQGRAVPAPRPAD
jgi:CubicO group peptidase (beta-lactamase class C family)